MSPPRPSNIGPLTSWRGEIPVRWRDASASESCLAFPEFAKIGLVSGKAATRGACRTSPRISQRRRAGASPTRLSCLSSTLLSVLSVQCAARRVSGQSL